MCLTKDIYTQGLLCIVMQKKVVYTRLDSDDIDKIDNLISKKEFDNRASFIRKAVNKYLKELEPKILA